MATFKTITLYVGGVYVFMLKYNITPSFHSQHPDRPLLVPVRIVLVFVSESITNCTSTIPVYTIPLFRCLGGNVFHL